MMNHLTALQLLLFGGVTLALATAAAAAAAAGRERDSSKDAPGGGDFTFSVGFTDDMVLQRDAVTAVYGFTASADAKVSVTVTDHSGTTYTVDAVVSPAAAGGGTANGLCQERCLAAGHCCVGQISACQKPSCAMGCIIAGRTPSVDKCKADCKVAASSESGCTFNVVSPAGPHHLPQDTTANESLQMCDNGPILRNGTQCSSCGGAECEQGCEFGSPHTQPRPAVWKAFLKEAPAGGSFSVTAVSSNAAQSITLARVTFGDVFFCSGQSNMDLALQYTFDKPQLDVLVAQGKYSNVRLFQYGDMGIKYEELVPTWVTTQGTIHDPTDGGGTWANLTTASTLIPGAPGPDYNLFGQFSASCFYFGVGLTDQMEGPPVPLGLIESAIGGSQIEAWTPAGALGACKNESLNADGIAPPSRLYNGMVAPFVNLTIKGVLWYQGENNCGGTMGNSATGYGYGCQLPAMVAAWRQQWSAVPGTTHPLAPFGVVTLAAGGSEGHAQAMAGMRWSQTGNYGVLPNPAMPNTFLAHAYDLGDPMDNLHPPCINRSSAAINASAFGPGGPCTWPPASAWNTAVRPLRDTVFKNAAPSFMGGIHPRFKHEVGRRLALAYNGVNSPTIAGCSLVQGAGGQGGAASLDLRFNTTLLGGDTLLLQWHQEQYNMSTWSSKDSSSLMVCLAAGTGGGGSLSTAASACLTDQAMWTAAPLTLADTSGTLRVDLRDLPAGSTVLAVRYAWPLGDGGDTCCPFTTVTSGHTPCVPGSCPILTAKTSLPANPFFATLVAGRCKCMAPQTCDA